MAYSPDNVYRQRFEAAQDYGLSTKMYYYSHPAEYMFGHGGPVGIGLVELLPDVAEEPAVVLDVGAGRGDYLAAVKDHYDDKVAAIGLTALAHKDQSNADISWVYGDLLRPDTWRPADQLNDGSVDLSVSRLTYHWLAHPLKALEINQRLLKPEGHLFVDVIQAHLDPATSIEVTGLVSESIEACAGAYNGGDYELNELHDGSHLLTIERVHMRGNTPVDFGKIALTGGELLALEN